MPARTSRSPSRRASRARTSPLTIAAKIHAERVARGFRGCVAYDCYGAGQRVTRALGPDALDAFLARREVHELLWLLTEARKLCPPSHPQLAAQLAEAIAALDAGAHHAFAARALLRRVGEALGGRAGAEPGIAMSAP